MAIDFPNSPTTGDLHTVNGKQWQWDAEKWIAYGISLAPDVLKVDSGNNRVGINQTSPAYSLDVTGTARITGDLTVQGTTTTIDSTTIAVQTSLVFEGATADAYETTLTLVDPTADRTITLPDATGTVALTGAVPTTITVADTTDTSAFVALWESATGDLAPKSDAGVTYNAGTGTLTATAFAGPLTGTATLATNVTVADTTDTSCNVALFESATGDLAPKSDAGLTYNAGTGQLNAVTSLGGFTGPSILTIPSNTAASMTLDASQAGAFVRINIVANNTVTVPPNSAVAFPIGTQIIFMVLNSGVTSFVAGSGVTIYSQNGTNSGNNGDLKIDGLYCSAALVKTLTDQWHLFGKLTS